MTRILLSMICLFGLQSAMAQLYPANYHLMDELRNLEVQQLVQDDHGFLWMGGSEGLYRYDGWQLLPFSSPLHAREVTLLQSTNSTLWVGYSNSALATVDNGEWTTIIDSFCTASISGIHVVDERLILATYGAGLWQFADNQLIQLIPDLSIYEMTATPSGDLWLATDQGVWQLTSSGQVKKQWTTAHGLPDQIVQHLEPSDSGVWAATYQDGIVFLHSQQDTVTSQFPTEQWTYGQIEDIVLQPDGTLWISTWDDGLLEWSPGQTQAFPVTTNQQLEKHKISTLLIDREGATWVLVNRVGLLNIRSDVALYQQDDFYPTGEVLAIHAGTNDLLWVSTMDGLFQYSITDRQWTPLISQGLTNSDLIIAIHESSPGHLWLGTFGQGLLYYNIDNQQVWRLTESEGLINNNILDIEPDEGAIWLATLGGVSKVIPTDNWPEGPIEFQNYDQQNGLGANYIYDVLVDQKGHTWFATDGKGLTRLDGSGFTTFDASNGLPSEVIYTVTEDPQGFIWFSTLHDGLYRFDGDSFLHFSRQEGLHGVDIVALASDPHGHLVIVHEEGIDVLNTQTFDIIHLEDDIGLLEINANLNVITTRKNGEVWLGLQEGMVRYKPGDERQAFQPNTLLEHIEVYLEPHTSLVDSVFSYQQNHLSFSYVGMWFANPQQVSFQYQLEGYDLDWITTKDREAIYPSLTPGKYTFKVRSSVDGRFENSPVVRYGFRIQRPFWQTGWFIGLLFILALSAFYLFVKSRERRLKKLERMEKERIDFQFQTLRSQVNPHFLFNSFNTLLNVIEMDKEKAVTYVEKLSDFFRSILAYRDAEVITLSDELRVVKDYYFLQQQRYGNNFSIHIDVENPEQYAVPPLLLQLLVENALKHNIVSRQKPLRVDIFLANEHLVVRNNLQRKAESEAGTRVGLANIRKRYQMLTSRPVHIEEDEQYFTVRLPIIQYQP